MKSPNGAWSSEARRIGSKPPRAEGRLDERPLAPLRGAVEHHRQGGRRRTALFAAEVGGDAGDRRGVQPAAEQGGHRPGAAQPAADRLAEEAAEALGRIAFDLRQGRVQPPVGGKLDAGGGDGETVRRRQPLDRGIEGRLRVRRHAGEEVGHARLVDVPGHAGAASRPRISDANRKPASPR